MKRIIEKLTNWRHSNFRMPHIETDIKLDFKDVLIRPKRGNLSSRSQVSLERKFVFKHSKVEWTGVPLIAANMDTIGTFEMANVFASRNCIVAIHKYYTLEEWREWIEGPGSSALEYVMVSSGIAESDLDKLDQILSLTGCKFICLDVANGYSQSFVNTIEAVRSRYPTHVIAAGNVVTSDMTEALILAGADIVKVGIGPGSVCTTRRMTGVGCPQLSAVLACADAAHGLGGRIISDGGCTCPGDVCKAFGAGADFVMVGGMLAGHEECAGEVERNCEGKWVKSFYGMSSAVAMDKHAGGVANYRASEGKCVQVPYKGLVDATICDILGGLRSCCTYVGASELRELSKRTTFYMVSQQINNVFGESTRADAQIEPISPKRK